MTRTRAVAIGVLLAGAIGVVVAVVISGRDTTRRDVLRSTSPTSPTSPLALSTRAAASPFVGYTEAEVGIGGRCRRVVVADSPDERVQGLRGHPELGPYDGMLFVFDRATEARFTMSGVSVPLDIGFYADDGSPVSRLRMRPCPEAVASCPDYAAGAAVSYALETLRGDLPTGGLSSCN